MKRRKSFLKSHYRAEYNALNNAIHRCHNENNLGFTNYGARGIKVAREWRTATGFALFLDCIGPRPSPKHSLDRINNDGNYEPGNVWWCPDRSIQQQNRRPHRTGCANLGWGVGYTKPNGTGRGHGAKLSPLIPLGDRIQTLKEWSDETSIHPATIRQRLQRGLTPAEALNPCTSRAGIKRVTPRNSLQLPTIH